MGFREITKKTNIDFIGLRHKAFMFSTALVILGVVAFVMVSMGKANLSVDFTGGTSLQVRFKDPVSIGDLRAALAHHGLPDVQIQEVSGTSDFFVKTKESEKVNEKVASILSRSLEGKRFEIMGSNMVGSAVGKALKKNAIIAIVISLACIVVYIWWRFDFVFGLAATIATFHDVLAMLGIFWALQREMNILFITALLTIAGYSLTDTVVVFDRIRENKAKMKAREDFGDVINRSINEVLSRTLITSLTVLIAVASILILGGEVLFDFSLALFIGVLIGTYSSIFVASPVVYIWRKKGF